MQQVDDMLYRLHIIKTIFFKELMKHKVTSLQITHVHISLEMFNTNNVMAKC